ncbi:MAG: hypothetical protein ABIJ37_03835 [Pseudomonadota bacterium]
MDFMGRTSNTASPAGTMFQRREYFKRSPGSKGIGGTCPRKVSACTRVQWTDKMTSVARITNTFRILTCNKRFAEKLQDHILSIWGSW